MFELFPFDALNPSAGYLITKIYLESVKAFVVFQAL